METYPSGPSGVPGALSNQPPGAASAPLTAPAAAAQPSAAQTPASTSSHRESTVNYEVDKTIRHVKGEVGAIKRLSVAVVVNHRRRVDKDGKVSFVALTEQEMSQIGNLVREAMGYSKERGDSVNVVNAPFSVPEVELAAQPSPWEEWLQRWLTPSGVVEAAKVGGLLLLLLYAWFGLLRPAMRDLMRIRRPIEPTLATAEGPEGGAARAPESPAAQRGYEADLQAAREIARQDPRIVANVVKDWVGRNE